MKTKNFNYLFGMKLFKNYYYPKVLKKKINIVIPWFTQNLKLSETI